MLRVAYQKGANATSTSPEAIHEIVIFSINDVDSD